MAFVYILESPKDKGTYIGSTVNLSRRVKEHEAGRVFSTKSRRPLKLVMIRETATLIKARLLEKKYKKSHGQLERDKRKGLLASYGV